MYRYSEGEKSFILVDGRDAEIPRFRRSGTVHSICLIHAADAIVILDKCARADFSLEIYCSDGSAQSAGGSPASLDGSAAACAVAFADLVGIKPFHSTDYTFRWAGTVFNAKITSHLGECKEVILSEPLFKGAAVCEGPLE